MIGNRMTVAEFRRRFVERTKAARNEAGYTQEEVARLLGIKQDLYKQYETRTPLPHYYIADFCLITNASLPWLFGLESSMRRRRQAPMAQMG